MKIAFCDDDARCRDEIEALLREYIAQSGRQDINLCVFSHGMDLLDTVEKTGGFAIYLLDIVMPGLDGISLGVRLRQSEDDGKILYLTSSREYAIDSFQAKPFNYILKPVQRSVLFSALDEAIQSIQTKKGKNLIVRTKNGNIKLSFDSILYAELCHRAITYHLVNGNAVSSIQIRSPFSQAVQPLLEDHRFVLCGTSLAVNLDHISMIELEALVFNDNCRVYPGKKACRELRSVWYDYCFDGEDSK